MLSAVYRVFYKELLISILGVLFAFLLLFYTIDVLNEVRVVGRDNYTVWTLLKVTALWQAEYVYQLMPICTLIGAVLALSSMAARSELVVWRASGLSLWQLVYIVVGVGLLLSVTLWLVGDLGIARASRAATEAKNTALLKTGFFKSDGGYWSKQNLENGDFRMINVVTLKNENELVNVKLFDLSPNFALKRITEAQTALPAETSGVWLLSDVRQIDITLDAKGLVEQRFEKKLPSLKVDLAENTLDVIRNFGVESVNLTMGQLNERIRTLSATGENVRPFEVAYWQKLFYPFSTVVMLLLALPFAFMQTRKGGVGGRVFTGIMLGLCFFVMTAAAQYIGPLVTWSPIALALVPSLFFLIIAIFWTYRVTRV